MRRNNFRILHEEAVFGLALFHVLGGVDPGVEVASRGQNQQAIDAAFRLERVAEAVAGVFARP